MANAVPGRAVGAIGEGSGAGGGDAGEVVRRCSARIAGKAVAWAVVRLASTRCRVCGMVTAFVLGLLLA